MTLDLVKYNGMLEDIKHENIQNEIIQNYHDGPNNYRGKNETETEIRKNIVGFQLN